jgi:heme-degrading monooxygenase HmoA
MASTSFHHVVLYRLREGVTLDRVRSAREALAALVETLPGVLDFAVTDNLSDRNGGYTLALFSSFEDRAAYEIFSRHPEFDRVWRELLEPVVADRIVAQGLGG